MVKDIQSVEPAMDFESFQRTSYEVHQQGQSEGRQVDWMVKLRGAVIVTMESEWLWNKIMCHQNDYFPVLLGILHIYRLKLCTRDSEVKGDCRFCFIKKFVCVCMLRVSLDLDAFLKPISVRYWSLIQALFW